MPTVVHAWPNSAACWSPTMPVMGASIPPNASGDVREMGPLESHTSGRFFNGTPNSSDISVLQPPLRMSNRRVREALDASVT